MEPRILMLGREQDIIDELVVLTSVVGMDDWQVAQDIKRLLPDIPILWKDRASGPEGMLDFVTSIAEDFRSGT